MTAQLKELREQQARIATNARAKFEEIKDDTPAERAKEIETEFDAMMAEYDAIGVKMERLKKLEAAEERANAPDPRRPKGDNVDQRGEQNGDDAPKYEDVFAKAVRYGAATLDAEERSVLVTGRADVPQELRAQSVGTDAAGGYTVPEGFSGEIDKAVKAWGPMWDADIVRELNTATGNDLPWPSVDDTDQEGEDHAENAAATDDASGDVTFGRSVLKAYMVDTKVVRIPYELLQDSAFDMEALLNDLFGERLGRRANKQLTVGAGGGSAPQGIVTGSSMGKTAAAAAALASDELIDLLHSVDPAYRASPKCRWQFNDTTLASVRKLKDGQGNYLWQMGDVRTGEPDRLLAHPYSVNQAMDSIAAGKKPIIFGDHSRYIVRKVRGFTVITLRERYAENFQIGMIGFKRFDGALLNNKAVKHLLMAAS